MNVDDNICGYLNNNAADYMKEIIDSKFVLIPHPSIKLVC